MRTDKPPQGARGVLRKLRAIEPGALKEPIEQMERQWTELTFNAQQRAKEALEEGRSFDARNYLWAAGVGTDKVFAFKGMPTQIVANMHEHRHDIGEVMDKLASAARVLTTHARKGYASPPVPVVRPVATPNRVLEMAQVAPSSEPGNAIDHCVSGQ